MEQRESRDLSPGLTLAGAIGLLAVVLLVAVVRNDAATPKSLDAAPDIFSAARAVALVERLGDGAPHPVGSSANDLVRTRLVAELDSLGLQPEVQSSVGCSSYGRCAAVDNVLARRSGTRPGNAILIVTHYDSVAAGPGAGDDLSGVVSLLEVARVAMRDPAPANDLFFLFTDGEEEGLLGAEAFAAAHPAMRDVRVVLNLEARGTGGPSLMFETGPASAELVRRFGDVCPRPLSSSISAAVYRAMPNDTDFSVFIRAGLPGLNFAFIGGGSRYHTPIDDLEHLDSGSVQAHGDCLLALTRSLGAGELPAEADGLVWFDVLGFGLASWPGGWSLPLSLLALMLVGVPLLRARRLGLFDVRSSALGVILVLTIQAAAFASAVLILLLIRWASGSSLPWPATLVPATIGFWSLGPAAAWGLGALLGRRLTPEGAWAGLWGGAALASVAIGAWFPEFVAPLLVPALVAGGTASLLSFRSANPASWAPLSTSAAAVILAVVAFGPMLALHDGLGMFAGPVASMQAAIIAGALLPLFSLRLPVRWAPAIATAGVSFVAFTAAIALPTSSPDIPRHINLTYHEVFGGEARWLAGARSGPLPAELRERVAFGSEPALPFPFSDPRRIAFEGPAPTIGSKPPEIEVIESLPEGMGKRVRLRMRSLRGARSAFLMLPPDVGVASVQIEGRSLPTDCESCGRRTAGWHSIGFVGLPDEGVVIDLHLVDSAPVHAILYDRVDALPSPLAEARPPDVMPQHVGDGWIVSREVEL